MKRLLAGIAGVIFVVVGFSLIFNAALKTDRELARIVGAMAAGVGAFFLYWGSRPREIGPGSPLGTKLIFLAQLIVLLLGLGLVGGSLVFLGIRSDRLERDECYVAWCSRPATWEGQSTRRGIGLGTWYPFCDEHIGGSAIRRPFVRQPEGSPGEGEGSQPR